eukprot:14701864-Alexandrium_andersonii.AAC.1
MGACARAPALSAPALVSARRCARGGGECRGGLPRRPGRLAVSRGLRLLRSVAVAARQGLAGAGDG